MNLHMKRTHYIAKSCLHLCKIQFELSKNI